MVIICNSRIDRSDAAKRDEHFINLLNNIRVGKCSEDNVKQHHMKKLPAKNAHPYVTLMFAKNRPKDNYNACKIGRSIHFEVKSY